MLIFLDLNFRSALKIAFDFSCQPKKSNDEKVETSYHDHCFSRVIEDLFEYKFGIFI